MESTDFSHPAILLELTADGAGASKCDQEAGAHGSVLEVSDHDLRNMLSG